MNSNRPRTGSTALLGALFAALLASALRAQEAPARLSLEDLVRELPALVPDPAPGLAWTADGEGYLFATPEGELVLRTTEGEERLRLAAAELAGLAKKAGLESAPGARDGWRAASLAGPLQLVRSDALVELRLNPEPELLVRRLLPAARQAIALAPNGASVAWVVDGDIEIGRPDGSVERITFGGGDDLRHGLAASRQEFGIQDGLWWSPDARRLAFFAEDLRPIDAFPYVDDRPTPAALVLGRYPMAGRAGSRVRIGVRDLERGRTVWLATDPARDEYLTNATWDEVGTRVLVVHVDRAQENLALVAYDAATGERTATLLEEHDPLWIEPESGPIFVPGGGGAFLWTSSSSGWRRLELRDAEGRFLRRLGPERRDLRRFAGWGEGGGFYLEAAGDDPAGQHLWWAHLDGGEARRVTRPEGFHRTELDPRGLFALDRWSSLQETERIELLRLEGPTAEAQTLWTAEDPRARWRFGELRRFAWSGADGRALQGLALLPPDYDPQRRYPALHYVYGGPHLQLVQDRWMGFSPRWMPFLRYLADHGVVVFFGDGRGTPWRGKEFEQAIHRRLGEVEVADQLALRAQVEGLFAIDPERVGVLGWSYGGYLTLCLSTQGGSKYRVALAGAPVTDWSYYETGYGERYMDRPEENPEGYRRSAPAAQLEGLRARLALVHGTADETVVFQHALAFLRRAIEAGKDVDAWIYPGAQHGLRGTAWRHFLGRATRFLGRELGFEVETAVAEPATAGGATASR